jgi:hypothetical protein
MAFVRIYLLSLLVSIFTIGESYAQNTFADKVVNNLYDLNDDTAKTYLQGNKVFMLVSAKSCLGCFSQLCEYFKQQKVDTAYMISFSSKDYLSLLPTSVRYKNDYPCVKDVFFYFISDKMDGEVAKAIEIPTPQLIILKDGKATHVPYVETLRLIGK